ncbi:hypothetical protein ACYTX7_10060, partial [Streptococcus pyogenes]
MAATIDLQQKIIAVRERTIKKLRASTLLSAEERRYCEQVYERLLEDCGHTMDDLARTSTDGKLSLKDDERLQRI